MIASVAADTFEGRLIGRPRSVGSAEAIAGVQKP